MKIKGELLDIQTVILDKHDPSGLGGIPGMKYEIRVYSLLIPEGKEHPVLCLSGVNYFSDMHSAAKALGQLSKKLQQKEEN